MANRVHSEDNMSDQSIAFICTTCSRSNKIIEAVKYCVECGGYCCQTCTDLHQNFPALSGHTISDITQASQSSGQPATVIEVPTERCSKHPSKVVDMYCEQHDDVGCHVCFVKDHKGCSDSKIHSIPDVINTIYNESDCKATNTRLKEMLVTLDTLNESTDTQLEDFDQRMRGTIDNVTWFQGMLETILRKRAESTKAEAVAVYEALKQEVLQKKQTIANIRAELLTLDTKLNRCEENRAQRFACFKLAESKIKEAECENCPRAEVAISFTVNESLREFLEQVQGIGQVKQETFGLYTVKRSKDISLKVPDDSEKCRAMGSCLSQDNQLLVTDYRNKKLKRIDINKGEVLDCCDLESNPIGVCFIGKDEVAVTLKGAQGKIQFISILEDKMTPTRQIETSHICFGVASRDGKLYVTNNNTAVFVHDMTGNLLKTIEKDFTGNALFRRAQRITFSADGSRMFVSDWYSGVVCFNRQDQYDSRIDNVWTIDTCTDGRGNIFVLGGSSENVVQFTESRKKIGVVVKQGDEIYTLTSICYQQKQKQMYVTLESSDVLKMFELS